MLQAAVPEATIHEYCDAQFGENEIGFAEDWLIPPPACDVLRAKKPNQRKFRVFVPVRTDAGHDFGTFSLGKDVRHQPSRLTEKLRCATLALGY